MAVEALLIVYIKNDLGIYVKFYGYKILKVVFRREIMSKFKTIDWIIN